jgi:hypothetical protein
VTPSLADRALRFVDLVAKTTKAAKAPDFKTDAWADLAALVTPNAFVLVGREKQELAWVEAVQAIDLWARETAFSYEVRRVEAAGSLVFMELTEHSQVRGERHSLETMTVFEFDTDGLIRRIDAFQ